MQFNQPAVTVDVAFNVFRTCNDAAGDTEQSHVAQMHFKGFFSMYLEKIWAFGDCIAKLNKLTKTWLKVNIIQNS